MTDIYFAQIREDGLAERQVGASAGRVACIGSGGCTALSMLDDHVSEVLIADANPSQCALIELKMAAIRDFDRDQFLAFIGDRPNPRRSAAYACLRPQLSDMARAYWDRRPDAIVTGINQVGVTERFYDFVGRNLRNSVVPTEVFEELFDTDSLDSQRDLFAQHFDTTQWRTALRILLSKQSQIQFYPAFWYARSPEHEFEDLLLPLLNDALTTAPVRDNYFLSQLFLGRYLDPDRRGAPRYLHRDGYAAAQRNLDKVRLVNLPIQAALAPERGIDAFFLSNIFDWGKPVHAREVWSAVLDAAAPDAVFLYRNMYRETDVPDGLSRRISTDHALSRDLRVQERSMLYRHLRTGVIH